MVERLLRKFQLDSPNHLPESMAVQLHDRSTGRHPAMAGGIQRHQATRVIGRHESGEVITVLDRRKFASTTEIPNRLSGPEILDFSKEVKKEKEEIDVKSLELFTL